jgi:tetratricopeptide (TPR) repeat protein
MAFISRFLVCLFIAVQSTSSFKHVSIQGKKALHMSSTDVFSQSSERIEVRTTTSDLSKARINDLQQLEKMSRKEVNAIHSSSADIIGEKKVEVSSLRILQKTDGPVPRSYLPALMAIDQSAGDINSNAAAIFAIVEEGMQWYFDTGGRASRIEVSCPSEISAIVQSMGFPLAGPSEDTDVLELRALDVQEGDGRVLLRCDPALFKAHCEARVQEPNANKYSLYDVIGRLAHDLGDPQGAIKPYTSALQVNSKSATTFRNMGSAYHAVGDLKLAFASYQQALQLDETGTLTKCDDKWGV